MMPTIDDPWDRIYKTTQAYNYEKREEAFITNTTKEEAQKNASQLIESEEMGKIKAEKKVAKKTRQKEKKKAEKTNDCNGEKKLLSNSATSLDNNVTAESNEAETVEASNDGDSDYFHTEEHNDDEFLDVNAAFVKVSVKRNKNISQSKTSISKPEKAGPSSDLLSKPMPKFIQPKINEYDSQAEALGTQSYHLALNDNDFSGAINILSQAIFLAPEDVRHHLNRSYCYLRLGQYDLALNDAQIARKKSQLTEHFVKAVAREGQALCGLQQYQAAEKCFEEILKLEEANEWILMELMLTRVFQLTNMGFSKVNALEALQQCPAVVDAVTLLTSGNISSPELENNTSELESESCDGDEIYFSDEESSSTILLSRLVVAVADESRYLENLQSQPLSTKNRKYSNSSERSVKSSVSMESLSRSNDSIQGNVMSNFKSLPSTSKSQIQKPIVSESSTIWVGSIDKRITDHKLQELFGACGPINYIRRFPDERNYLFIDFNSKRAASKALNNPNGFKINGIILPVKPTRGLSGQK